MGEKTRCGSHVSQFRSGLTQDLSFFGTKSFYHENGTGELKKGSEKGTGKLWEVTQKSVYKKQNRLHSVIPPAVPLSLPLVKDR